MYEAKKGREESLKFMHGKILERITQSVSSKEGRKSVGARTGLWKTNRKSFPI